jgi:hypothetical protein
MRYAPTMTRRKILRLLDDVFDDVFDNILDNPQQQHHDIHPAAWRAEIFVLLCDLCHPSFRTVNWVKRFETLVWRMPIFFHIRRYKVATDCRLRSHLRYKIIKINVIFALGILIINLINMRYLTLKISTLSRILKQNLSLCGNEAKDFNSDINNK